MMSKLTPFQEHIFKKLHKTEYKLLLKQLDQDITRAFSTKNKLKAILDNELLELNEQTILKSYYEGTPKYHKKYISSLSKKEQEYSDYVKQQQELITEIHHYLILAQRKIREL